MKTSKKQRASGKVQNDDDSAQQRPEDAQPPSGRAESSAGVQMEGDGDANASESKLAADSDDDASATDTAKQSRVKTSKKQKNQCPQQNLLKNIWQILTLMKDKYGILILKSVSQTSVS